MGTHTWELGSGGIDADLCAEVYRRSWPHSAEHSYDPAEMQTQIARHRPVYWDRLLRDSEVRIAGEVDGWCGFALVTREATGLELSYLFVEPEAFGTGLSTMLHDEVVRRAERPLHAWVLESNERSVRFFTQRGWQPNAGVQPEWAGRHRYVQLVLP